MVDVAVVVHAFEESSTAGQKSHLELWFGRVDGMSPEGQVCRCGAEGEWLDKARTVMGVWHRLELRS